MFSEEKILNRFMEYVKIGSETGNEREFYERLIEDLKEIGAEVTVDGAGESCGSNANNIYAKFKGNKDVEPLIFSCHMDTVKPGINIEPEIDGGRIKSKGDTILGSDDKSGITALIEAMEIINSKKRNHGPVQMVFTISEEGGLKGSKNLNFDKLIGKRCYVLDSSGQVGKIIVQAPAQNKISAVITGKPAHAGIAPEKGVSAIMVGSEAIHNMELLRIDNETTANIGTFESIGETNIVSPIARIVGEIRSLDKKKIEKQTNLMENCLRNSAVEHGAEIDISIEKMYEPFCISENDDIVKYVKSKCETINIKPFTASTGGGSDANVYNSKGIKTLNLGCGVNNAHTKDEFISVRDLIDLTKLAYNLILG